MFLLDLIHMHFKALKALFNFIYKPLLCRNDPFLPVYLLHAVRGFYFKIIGTIQSLSDSVLQNLSTALYLFLFVLMLNQQLNQSSKTAISKRILTHFIHRTVETCSLYWDTDDFIHKLWTYQCIVYRERNYWDPCSITWRDDWYTPPQYTGSLGNLFSAW